MPELVRKPSARSLCWGVLTGVLLAGITIAGNAQVTQPKSKPVIKTDTVTTADGWTIPITYYQSAAGKDAAVVILLHGEGENQLVWKQKTTLATRLHAENFSVITCDLRKHGEAKHSRSTNKKLEAMDFQAMAHPRTSELEAIHDFLFVEHEAGRLNMAKLGIVAVDNMAPSVLIWAQADWLKKPHQDAPTLSAMTPRGQTVRAIALVSPSENATGVSSAPALRFFRMLNGAPVSMLFVNGDQDGSARDLRNMEKLVSTPRNKAVIFTESFAMTKLKGTDLLARVPKAEPLLVGFMKKQLQDLNVDWQSRKSRLDR